MGEERTFRTPRERRFYHRLRDRVKHWAERRRIPQDRMEFLLIAPDLFVLLSRLALDGRVPSRTKAKVAAGLAYFVSPFDLVPDFLGPAGFLDDVIVAAWIVHTIIGELNQLDRSILQDHWEGEEDVLIRVRNIIEQADDVLGRGLRFVTQRLRSGRGFKRGM
ncbi:MAG: YkvA family protein [Anaerolineae bacterium]